MNTIKIITMIFCLLMTAAAALELFLAQRYRTEGNTKLSVKHARLTEAFSGIGFVAGLGLVMDFALNHS